jgi:single-stranded-DNA-specific exonuclease
MSTTGARALSATGDYATLRAMNDTIWHLCEPHPAAAELASALGLPPEIARVLTNRGIETVEAARTFLYGGLEDLHDPFLMKGMEAAVARIRRATARGEKILIFGDYDADGVLSTVMLHKALRTLGADVDYYIPDRLEDGYGIKDHHADILTDRGAKLVISVDCGIKAVGFTARAGAGGVDVIITDHHYPGSDLPNAVAVLNPVLSESGYPDKALAGVGVVFKLIQALLITEGREASLPHYMKLVSIGTVADVARLIGENRLFVRHGLKALEDVANPGLKRLMDVCGLQNRVVQASDLGFRLGPRINAAGRMGQTDLAVRLFFAETDGEARDLVARLEALNTKRQGTEEKIFQEAREMVEARGLDQRYKCLILGCETWHKGVIGIVASKIKETFHRPVILFSYEDGRAVGSGRSISDFALIDLLDACEPLFQSYGGHKLAVGCTLARENMTALREAVNALAEEKISGEDLKRKLRIDACLDFEAITPDFMEHFERLNPFGPGNPKPLFLTRGAEIMSEPRTMRGRHMKFLARRNGRFFEAVGWDKADWAARLARGRTVDLVYSVTVSEYLGETKTTLTIEDIRL